jgi:polysaccharide export outer membrane protein
MGKNRLISMLFLLIILGSCKAYRQNIILKTKSSSYPADIEYQKTLAEKNYKICVNDRLTLRVYTNEGERIIDPDYELSQRMNNQNFIREEKEYLVQLDSLVKFPMVGLVHLQGLTIREGEKVDRKSTRLNSSHTTCPR